MTKFFAFACAILFCAGCSTKSKTPIKVTYDHAVEVQRHDDGIVMTNIIFDELHDGIIVDTTKSSELAITEGETATFNLGKQWLLPDENEFDRKRDLMVKVKTQAGEDGKLNVFSEMTDTETLKDGTESIREQESRVYVLDRS